MTFETQQGSGMPPPPPQPPLVILDQPEQERRVVPFNDLRAQNERAMNELFGAFRRAAAGQLVFGLEVEAFERELARSGLVAQGSECVSVGSGTDALMLALQAVGVGVGVEVLTVANSAPATAAAIASIGAKPVYVDVDENGLIDPAKIEPAITPRTYAIVPVHLYGRMCDMRRIQDVAFRRCLRVVEDACQAIGATTHEGGLLIGQASSAAALSFYPTKNLGALGDGGAVITRSKPVADQVRLMRNYGLPVGDRDHQQMVGRNSRLDAIQAAILRAKLAPHHFHTWQGERQKLARLYESRLPAQVQRRKVAGENFHLFTIHHDRRDELRADLAGRGIETLIHYPVPSNMQRPPAIQRLSADLPKTQRHCDTVLSLPFWPGMSEEQVKYVAEAVTEFVRRHSAAEAKKK